jgi:uncharacterized membrane protein
MASGQNIGAAAVDRADKGAPDHVEVRSVPFDRPWDWLAAGWRDLWTSPGVSLAYGALATVCGLLLTLGLGMANLESLVPVMGGGFLLVGPLLAVGLYEKSRLLSRGEAPTLGATASAAVSAAMRLGFLSAFLLFLYLVWMRIAFMLLALFLGTQGLPPAREFMPTLLFTTNGLGLLIVGTAVGAVLAALGFAATAVSIPLLMDRRLDAMTAMAKSFEAVIRNPKPMGLWAALIAGFIALGMATIGLGLVVAFPLLGHATWHAYRDLVQPPKS